MTQQKDVKLTKTDLKIQTGKHTVSAVLLTPDDSYRSCVVLAHGAGGNMHAPFMRYFHEGIAAAGYPSLKFNFPYSEARRKAPDSQSVLTSCYKELIRQAPGDRVIIGGKSMGGRMASYVADDARVHGLLFLGYPLHPPGKHSDLRDEHLYSLRKPMLFVAGTRDPFARLDLLENVIAKLGSHAELDLVPDGGHSLEVPARRGRNAQDVFAEVLQKIVVWLKKVSD